MTTRRSATRNKTPASATASCRLARMLSVPPSESACPCISAYTDQEKLVRYLSHLETEVMDLNDCWLRAAVDLRYRTVMVRIVHTVTRFYFTSLINHLHSHRQRRQVVSLLFFSFWLAVALFPRLTMTKSYQVLLQVNVGLCLAELVCTQATGQKLASLQTRTHWALSWRSMRLI